jgi:hypothetical protein
MNAYDWNEDEFDVVPFNYKAVKSIAVDTEGMLWAMTLHCFTGEGSIVVIKDALASDFMEWRDGELIQNVFPQLSADQREMLMTGIPPEEQEEMMNEFCDS